MDETDPRVIRLRAIQRLEKLALASFVGLDLLCSLPDDEVSPDELGEAYRDACDAGRLWAACIVAGYQGVIDLDRPDTWPEYMRPVDLS